MDNRKKGLSMVYIYGAGEYGKIVYDRLLNEKASIGGFIISDGQEKKAVEGCNVYYLSEIHPDDLCDSDIYIALSEKFWPIIAQGLSSIEGNYGAKLIYLKKNDIQRMKREMNPVDNDLFLHVQPISRDFGCDRGTAVDRYYIERFLLDSSRTVKQEGGLTLEVGEDVYSKRFFPDYEHRILDYSKGMDLTKHETLPDCEIDVFICTQVLNFIYDVKSAIEGCYTCLKHGGVLLATVAGNISQISQSDMENYGDYWRFTYLSIRMLFSECFGDENVKVVPYGNCMAATAFVQGVALEDLVTPQLLDLTEENYAICIGVLAKKE